MPTPANTLRTIPLGGLGNIGRNMMLYEVNGESIAVDCGLMFPEDEHLGVDIIIPDFSYLREAKTDLKALFLTHGHEDHIGAAAYLLREFNIPVFCTKLTRGLVQVKLQEHHLANEVSIQSLDPGSDIDIGNFNIEFFQVSHSIPDSAGLIIRTDAGTVIHTGDFKIDHTPIMGQHTDLNRLAEVGNEGVVLLCADSTYAEIDGYTPSETLVAERLENAVANASGRIIMTTFASLISRIQIIIDAAIKFDKRIFVTGRSMEKNIQISRDLGYISAPDQVFMSRKEMRTYPSHKTIIICTGSQGEPNAALSRIARGNHQYIEIQEGDTVILSSNPVPGNEKSVSKNINMLFEAGADVIYNQIDNVHVRGHAAKEELKIIHRIIKPQNFVPIHGEFRHLVHHAQLAINLGMDPENVFVLEDGDVLEINEEYAEIAEHVATDYIYIDQFGNSEINETIIHERQKLADKGVLMITFFFNENTKSFEVPISISSYGFIQPEDEASIYEDIKTFSNTLLEDTKNTNIEQTQKTIEKKLSQYLFELTRRKPIVRAKILTQY
ncbi:MAG: ribonuclease J [Chloroflexi bacterium]|nr:ribonuclease J [Chloroflexota bacterium]|tara:strand:- start:12574 stop:14235 length:1662 start_codon:yes stop_codon:yes gene_type:complete